MATDLTIEVKLTDEMKSYVDEARKAIAQLPVTKAVLEEREACIKIILDVLNATGLDAYYDCDNFAQEVIARIRVRGTQGGD